MNSWTRGRILGHGSTATVSLAASLNSGDVFAVKSAELSQSEFLQREQRIHSSIESSPYIVSYRGCEITKEDNKFIYNLFLDYMPGGTLTDFVHPHGGQLEESVIGFYTFQIVEALDYLHSNGIVHCDIKGRNILIGETGAKIADFGCAKRIDSAAAIGGTPMFMAPEVARGEEQGFCSDVWALGCTIVEMATGGPPWSSNYDDNAVSTIYRIGFSDELPEFPEYFSDEAKDFLDKCLRRNPTERWTVKQLLNHSFLSKLKCENGKEKSNSNSISYSPTSILEQGFWNSVVDDEESDMINGSSTSTSSTSGGGSERIRGLCLNESLLGGATNWEWDENWITVRCDEKKKKKKKNIESNNNNSNMMMINSNSDSNIRRRRSCKYGKNSFLVKDDDLLIPY